MDLLLTVQALIIASIIGVILTHALHIKSPMYIGLIIALIFAAVWHLFNKYNMDIVSSITATSSSLSSLSNMIYSPAPNPAPSSTPKAEGFSDTVDKEDDALPFDNLEPAELIRRLNIIYEATSNPLKVAHHQNDITPADMRLTADNSSLASTSDLHLTYTNWLYPLNTKKQVNTGDCTNYETSDKSCIQHPTQLNDYPLKSCTKYNMPPDDYSKSMEHALMRAGGIPVLEAFNSVATQHNNNNKNSNSNSALYYNAPKNARTKELCRTCKIGVCKNDVCI